MTDHKTIASRYIDLWNERTPQRRREMLGGELDHGRQIRRSPDVGRRP